jgi:hypothetical protein
LGAAGGESIDGMAHRDLLDIRDKMRFAIVTAEAFMSKLEKLERTEL